MESIIQSTDFCYLFENMRQSPKCNGCGIETHHAWKGTANRKLSDQDGLTVKLCPACHRYLHSKDGHEVDIFIKQKAQEAWEKKYGNRGDFIKRYGKSELPSKYSPYGQELIRVGD